MKKVLSVIVTFALLLTIVPTGLLSITASAATSGNYTYEIVNNGAIITKANTTISGSVTIPSTLGGYDVTEIGAGAFASCNNITSVTVPATVKIIHEAAFMGCEYITKLTIGAAVEIISSTAFMGCTALTNISVNSANHYYYSSGNCIIETNTGTLVLGCKNSVIPNNGTITAIGPNAFYFCKIDTLTIPSGVTVIGDSAFLGSSILSIDLGTTLTRIEANAFTGCEKLMYVTVPSTINYVGTNAFMGCSEIYGYEYCDGFYIGNETNECIILLEMHNQTAYSYTLASTVKIIYDEAMSLCSNVKNFTIPNSVTSVGAFAFANCTSLTNLTVPSSVEFVGASAFLDCDNLVYNVYNNGRYLGNSSNKYVVFVEPTTKNISNFTFANSVKCIGSRAFYGCENLTSITIPSNISNINEGAFEGCTSLEHINLGDNVKYIGGFAFMGCSSLKEITISGSLLSVGGYAFYNCPQLGTVNYKGTSRLKSKISVIAGNDYFLNANWNFLEFNDYSQFSGTTQKPVSPIVIDYTETSVTLYPFEGYEFSKDGIIWQDSNHFVGLEENTTYTFYQRIKTTKNEATASSIVATTAHMGWNTSLEFEYIQYIINENYNTTDEGYPCILVVTNFSEDLTGYYAFTNMGDFIRFTLLTKDTSVGTLTYMDLYKDSTHLNLTQVLAYYSNGQRYDGASGTAYIERYEHQNGKEYDFYRSGTYITNEIFSETFNACFGLLTGLADYYLYSNYDSGLRALGLTAYDGYGPTFCDTLTDYHLGTETRGAYNAGCLVEGNTGSTYCYCCNQLFAKGTAIPATGEHYYDNDCDETCNICNEYREIEHVFRTECDVNCDICGEERMPLTSHIFDSQHDLVCNDCSFVRPAYIPGDIDGIEGVSDADARYLLMYTFFPDDYPVDQSCDFNGDSFVDDNDARYLLMHTFFPQDYPLG